MGLKEALSRIFRRDPEQRRERKLRKAQELGNIARQRGSAEGGGGVGAGPGGGGA